MDEDTPGTSRDEPFIDWTKCVLCQEDNDEQLQCPADIRRSDIEYGVGYQSLESSIQRFAELGCLPIPLDLQLLNEGSGIAETLKINRTKWHKICRNKFSNLKIERVEKRKRSSDTAQEKTGTRKVTRKSSSEKDKQDGCFFCGEITGELHQASTFNMDKRVRKCATELQDTFLLAKLSSGDLISQEAVYHSKCRISLYNRARKSNSQTEESTHKKRIEGIVLAELATFMEEARIDSEVAPVFVLAELAKLYQSRLNQLGGETSSRINTTHLKSRILANMPDIHSFKQGRNIMLAFKQDIGFAIQQACENDFDDEALILAKAATIVRNDMIKCKSSFKGYFSNNCQKTSVPQSLTSLVGMILGGPNIEAQTSNIVETQATLTISQLLQFNLTVRRRKGSTALYHSTEREPPLSIYLGIMLHAATRKRGLVDKLYDLGLSISYDRVLDLSTALGKNACAQFEAEMVVCPSKLRRGIFTSSAVDNIDHNPSSTTAQGSFHGTGISLFQHPSDAFAGEERNEITDATLPEPKDTAKLPESYTNVQTINIHRKEPEIPNVQGPFTSDCGLIPEAIELEKSWLKHVERELEAESSDDMQSSWPAFHASKLLTEKEIHLDISSLLPLFNEQAKSVSMIRHSMDVISKAVEFLNRGQVPVMACDQPLFALAKQIQWSWPDTHGESKFVVMFGGLHIEIAALKTIGDWLDDSGWTNVITQTQIATVGTADSFLKASHVSRTRHAHQVTAAALHILISKAYKNYIEDLNPDSEPLDFEAWKLRREVESPQFRFWSITLQFELVILIFVRSIRERNFQLYKDVITYLVPWIFALDRPNYARWLSIYIRDMMDLATTHQSVEVAFENGNFVVNKTQSVFSSIAIDHAHEQNNQFVKGDGGVVGLTENPSQLQRWMVCGPEVARVVNEFEFSNELLKRNQSKGPDIRHHEQIRSVQINLGSR